MIKKIYLCCMRLFGKILCYISAIYLLLGCVGMQQDNSARFANIVYQPNHASGFVIAEDDDQNTIIRVTKPWQGDAVVEQSLAIFKDEEAARGYCGE